MSDTLQHPEISREPIFEAGAMEHLKEILGNLGKLAAVGVASFSLGVGVFRAAESLNPKDADSKASLIVDTGASNQGPDINKGLGTTAGLALFLGTGIRSIRKQNKSDTKVS